MRDIFLILVYFFYGLAFFSMGLAILLELGHGTDLRLRHALRPLAAFGLVHGTHEWWVMFEKLGLLPYQEYLPMTWKAMMMVLLAFSFLSLAAFGSSLMTNNEQMRRLSLLLPLGLSAIWGFGMLILRSRLSDGQVLVAASDVWTRYTLAIPASLFACAGLIYQQREFRRSGMAQFGRDSLWAAIAFSWYGVVGQTFTQASVLPPSTLINQELFLRLFGFPVQLLRAGAAIVAAVFVMRFLRSFEVAIQRQISALQAERLQEAQRREELRGEMLRRIVAAQEAERQRVARELHDETGQALTAIGLGLRGATSLLQQHEVDKAASNLRRMESLVDRSLLELQHMIADLRPSHLDDLGLPAALRWYAGEINSRVPLLVSVDVSGEPCELPSEVRMALFRVAQEAVTNVIKHACAEKVWIHLGFGDRAVCIIVRDNGCGFDPKTLAKSRRVSWGILGMEERAALLGGRFVLTSEPGGGTEIRVTIPYSLEMEATDGDSTASRG